MTQQTRVTLKAKFEQGDTPQGTDYEDMIDSALNLADTTAQSMGSPLSVTGAISASTTVSANTVEASAASFTDVVLTGTVSASAGAFGVLTVGGQAIVPSAQRAAVEVYIEATALVTCSATAAFTAIAVSASSGTLAPVDFSAHSTQVKVTYTGASEKSFRAAVYISSKLNTGTNDLVEYTLLKNDVALDRTRMSRFHANATDFGSVSTGCIVEMSATDTLAVGLRNTTDVVNIDVGSCNFVITEV